MADSNKKHSISVQISRPVLIFEIFFIIFSFLFLFIYNMSHYLNERFDSAVRLGKNTASILESYDSLSFLVPYWQENYQDMELFYGDEQKLAQKEKLLRDKLPDMTEAKYVTSKQAEALDDEGRLLLAEICYYELSESFDLNKRTYEPVFLSSFVMNGNESFFLVTGTREDEARISSGGDLFEIGSVTPYQEGVYPILDEIIRTGEPVSSMELSMRRGADRSFVHTFEPVYADGKLTMFVGSSMQWKDLISEVLRMSLLMAVVAAVLFLILGIIFMKMLNKIVLDPLKKEQSIINEY